MKTTLTLTHATLAILFVAALGACGKKKGNSAAPAPAAGYTTCTSGTNPYTGQPCQIGTTIYAGGAAGTTTCTSGTNPYTGQPCQIGTPIYTGAGGTNICTTGTNPYTGQPCQIGTPIYGGQQPGGFGGGFGGGYGGGCEYYTFRSGYPWYPRIVNGQLWCVSDY